MSSFNDSELDALNRCESLQQSQLGDSVSASSETWLVATGASAGAHGAATQHRKPTNGMPQRLRTPSDSVDAKPLHQATSNSKKTVAGRSPPTNVELTPPPPRSNGRALSSSSIDATPQPRKMLFSMRDAKEGPAAVVPVPNTSGTQGHTAAVLTAARRAKSFVAAHGHLSHHGQAPSSTAATQPHAPESSRRRVASQMLEKSPRPSTARSDCGARRWTITGAASNQGFTEASPVLSLRPMSTSKSKSPVPRPATTDGRMPRGGIARRSTSIGDDGAKQGAFPPPLTQPLPCDITFLAVVDSPARRSSPNGRGGDSREGSTEVDIHIEPLDEVDEVPTPTYGACSTGVRPLCDNSPPLGAEEGMPCVGDPASSPPRSPSLETPQRQPAVEASETNEQSPLSMTSHDGDPAANVLDLCQPSCIDTTPTPIVVPQQSSLSKSAPLSAETLGQQSDCVQVPLSTAATSLEASPVHTNTTTGMQGVNAEADQGAPALRPQDRRCDDRGASGAPVLVPATPQSVRDAVGIRTIDEPHNHAQAPHTLPRKRMLHEGSSASSCCSLM